ARGRCEDSREVEGSAGEGEVGPAAAGQGGHGTRRNPALATGPEGEQDQRAGGRAHHGNKGTNVHCDHLFLLFSLSVHSLPLSLCLCLCLPLSLSLPHALQPCLSLSLSLCMCWAVLERSEE